MIGGARGVTPHVPRDAATSRQTPFDGGRFLGAQIVFDFLPKYLIKRYVGDWVGDCSGEGGARETGAHSAHARDAPAGRPIEGTCVGIDDEPPPPAVPPAPQPRRGDRYY